LGKDNHVFYYEGELKGDASNFKSSGFKEIRDVIINKRKDVISRYVRDPDCEAKAQKEGKKISDCAEQDFVVIIKPNKEATFKNTVDILDEMTINGVKRYAMIDITPTEEELIRRTEGGAPQK